MYNENPGRLAGLASTVGNMKPETKNPMGNPEPTPMYGDVAKLDRYKLNSSLDRTLSHKLSKATDAAARNQKGTL